MKRFLYVVSIFLFLCFAGAQGKLKVALLGDSMTWIGGENFEKPEGWTHYITDLPLEIRSYARSGATWTNTRQTKKNVDADWKVLHPDNVIYNQMLRLERDTAFQPDLIVIYAGANDAWFADRYPDIFEPNFRPPFLYTRNTDPADVTSLCGSIEMVCFLLGARYPDAEIHLVTPVQAGKIPPENIEAVSEMIENVGKENGATVYRADREIPFSHSAEASNNKKYTTDGVHTNPLGAKLIADSLRNNIFLPAINSNQP